MMTMMMMMMIDAVLRMLTMWSLSYGASGVLVFDVYTIMSSKEKDNGGGVRGGGNNTTTTTITKPNILYYERCSVIDDGHTVQYVYSLNEEVFFYSTLRLRHRNSTTTNTTTTTTSTTTTTDEEEEEEEEWVELDLGGDEERGVWPLLYEIGFCLIPWYWMGWGMSTVMVRAGPLHDWQVNRSGGGGDDGGSEVCLV